MKKHAIIPIFISHRGCPNMCVFCNQRAITARSGDVTVDDARRTVEQWLTTLNPSETEIEISFFGGSFTGIPMEEQTAFLALAKEYKDAGRVHGIHCSTRPDYITPEILDNLKAYGTDVIELGVQSFDERVLAMSKRGHDEACIERACAMIREWGFTLGIQLMIGLPGDSFESCMYSAAKAIEMKPDIARLYPTVVLENTELCEMMKRGEYEPRPEAETVRITKAMYLTLTAAGIKVIRIGLKSNENIRGETFNPAIGQIVRSEVAREEIERRIEALALKKGDRIEISAAPELLGFAVGHKGSNKKYFKEKYPDQSFCFRADAALEDTVVRIKAKSLKKKPKVYLSEAAGSELIDYLVGRGFDTVFVSAGVDSPIGSHPDVYMCALPKGIKPEAVPGSGRFEGGIYFGDAEKLTGTYPGDVRYNAAAVGKYLVCSKYTDGELIRISGLEPVTVPQGYVKCNLVVLDDSSVITEDEGISRALADTDIECLLITPHQVALDGYPCGFIGGASGRIGNTVVFNGNIRAHSSYREIKAFIESRGLKIKDFDYPLTDIGSIIGETYAGDQH